jgi:hypothetical protein
MVASDAAAELPSRRTASSALSQAPTMAALIAATFSAIRSPVALDSSGQLAHLGRHHREPAAELAGAGGLDGRVQGQEAGLARDALHVLGHLVELLGPAAQLLDLGQHGRLAGCRGLERRRHVSELGLAPREDRDQAIARLVRSTGREARREGGAAGLARCRERLVQLFDDPQEAPGQLGHGGFHLSLGRRELPGPDRDDPSPELPPGRGWRELAAPQGGEVEVAVPARRARVVGGGSTAERPAREDAGEHQRRRGASHHREARKCVGQEQGRRAGQPESRRIGKTAIEGAPGSRAARVSPAAALDPTTPTRHPRISSEIAPTP